MLVKKYNYLAILGFNPKLWCIRKNARRALLCRNPGLTKLAGVCISPQTISVEDTSQSIYKFERQGKGLRPLEWGFRSLPHPNCVRVGFHKVTVFDCFLLRIYKLMHRHFGLSLKKSRISPICATFDMMRHGPLWFSRRA